MVSVHGWRCVQVCVYMYLLIAIWTQSCVLIICGTVHIRTIVERPISSSHWSSSPLVHKVPVETAIRTVLCTLMLLE